MPGEGTVAGQRPAQRTTKRPAGGPGQTRRIGPSVKTALQELLAIGLVGLTTYLVVSLIIWLVALFS